MTFSHPDLPPAFSGHAVMPGESVVVCAADGARSGRLEAGDLVWSMDEATVGAAFVLEPEVRLLQAMEMVPLLMVAIGDALGSIGPPNLAFTYRWPNALLANGALVGSVQAALPDSRSADEVPDWLAVGFDLRLTEASLGAGEPGHRLKQTALHLEGAGDIHATMMIEAVARHFLSWIDGWQQDGFKPAHGVWTGRADTSDEPLKILGGGQCVEGIYVGLDEHGGLLMKTGGAVRSISLADALIADGYLHAETAHGDR